MQSPHCDIAIVGAGPTGLVLANLLGQAGISVMVLDRAPDVVQMPRAMHFDGEGMRIFQSIGLADLIAKLARPAPLGTRYMTAEGQTLLVRQGFGVPGPHGWFVSWHFHQPDLERVLRDGLARFPNVELRLSSEVLAVEVRNEGAVIRVHDSPSNRNYEVHARYVVGCDGARSTVRKTMDVEMEDLGLHQPWLVVDMLVNPASPRVAGLPDYALQLCDPKRPMSILYVSGNRRRWEIMIMSADDPARMTEPDNFWPLLARWMGPMDGEIERSAVYTFHSLIAHGWRRGPLLLAGDACHLTPPFLGQGMCAGLRDAANLAWKLALVVKNQADPALLDTYEAERRPHVKTFIELSVRLGGILQTTDPIVAAQRDRQFAQGGSEIFPFPNPPLGPGVRDAESPASGQIFPQPRLGMGHRLDDVVGGRFAVIGSKAVLDAVDDGVLEIWKALDVVVLADPEGELAATIEQMNIAAIVLRPDAYVFGSARNADQLCALTRRLAESLRLVAPSLSPCGVKNAVAR